MGSAGGAEAFHGAFARLPGRLGEFCPRLFRYLDCRCSTRRGAGYRGVDEHRWSHTRNSEGFVTVIIDLTPILERTGHARLLDLVSLDTWAR